MSSGRGQARQDGKGSYRGRFKEEKDEEVAKVMMDDLRGSSGALQIFVKVDSLKVWVMDVSSNDKISDVVRRSVGCGKQDMCAT